MTASSHQEYERGHADAVESICRLANLALDGKDDGENIYREPWKSVRKRLLAFHKLEKALHANRCHPDYIYTTIPAGISKDSIPSLFAGWEPNTEWQVMGDECWRHKLKISEKP